MKVIILVISLVSIICLEGCSDETTSTSSTSNNYVNIRSVNDTLAINISATNHNYNQNLDLIFSVDTVNLNMSVSGTGAGTGLFIILKNADTLYSKDLNSNFQVSQQIFGGPPTNAIVILQNYKGNASILLTK